MKARKIVLSHAVYKMMVGPSLATYRSSQQTALRCWKSNFLVLSGQGKGVSRHQVGVRETNANEPLLKCRERVPTVKTEISCDRGISIAVDLFTGYAAVVIEES